jgi:hypothetical protein
MYVNVNVTNPFMHLKDATCVCTTTSASCAPVSQAILSLVPYTTQLFNVTISPYNLSLELWNLQGSPVGDCSSQALILDVGAALDASKSPIRTIWARSTLLYTLIATDNLARAATLKTFISALNFTLLGTPDGAVEPGQNSITSAVANEFLFKDSTFSYNYATLNYTVPPDTNLTTPAPVTASPSASPAASSPLVTQSSLVKPKSTPHPPRRLAHTYW